jgi:hypothetical protein
MCGAVGSRGRKRRRQGTRCERYCDAMLTAPLTAPCPRRVTAIHMRLTAALRSMVYTRLIGGDQPLKGLNLISEATLNVLEPGGGREIIAVEEKRSHVCHEHMSFTQEIVRLGQFGIGEERLSASGGHVSFANA